jgi:hypothetical protein
MTITARNSSEQYYADKDYKWMSADQWECFEMLCDLCRGSQHIGGKVKPAGRGILVNLKYGFHAATWDFNDLTRAVVMAHDRCIRFEISPSGPGMLQLSMHKRHSRDGGMSERHPTLEEAILTIRNKE